MSYHPTRPDVGHDDVTGRFKLCTTCGGLRADVCPLVPWQVGGFEEGRVISLAEYLGARKSGGIDREDGWVKLEAHLFTETAQQPGEDPRRAGTGPPHP